MVPCSSVLVLTLLCGILSLTNGQKGEQIELFFSDYNKIDVVDIGTLENNTITDGLRSSLSLDYHTNKELVVIADTYSSISVVGTAGLLGTRETIVQTKVGRALGIALDWIRDHVYWTDETFQSVQVSNLDGSFRTSLIEYSIDKPRAIAIDASTGILFFADWGNDPRIERCGLDGEDRESIVFKVLQPNGLTIDHKAKRIYWTDGLLHEINSANYDGTGIKNVIKGLKYLPNPFGIDIFRDKVYWTNLMNQEILRTDKYASYEVDKVFYGENPTGIKVFYSEVKQHSGKSVCEYSNGGCSDLCLPSAPWSINKYSCACADGYTLRLLDRKTCYYSGRHVRVLLAERKSVTTTDIESLEIKHLYQLNDADIVGIDYHYKENLIYWSDQHRHNIYIYQLSGKTPGIQVKQILQQDTFRPGNIAVDWVYNHIYWMETLHGQIHVSFLNGKYRKTLIRDLVNPSGLALYPEEGFMFFSEYGYRFDGRITWSAMDGSRKKHIIVRDIKKPLGLTIDYPARRIYWTDASLHEIKSSTFDGDDVHTVLKFKSDEPFGIAVYGDTLFWSSSSGHDVYTAHKYNGGYVKPFISELTHPRHLKIASESTQKKGSNRCIINESKCDHLCLPVPLTESKKGFSCACADGYHMIENRYCVKKESAKLVKEEL